MPSDLAVHIEQLAVVDTHEHQFKEAEWVEHGPADVLADLFWHYVGADLTSAGAAPKAVDAARTGRPEDFEARWAGIRPYWEAVQFTGYGEAVRLQARHVYGIEALSGPAIRRADPILRDLRQPGQRLHLLRDVARLDHVQVDDFTCVCAPDPAAAEFVFYDLSWADFASGTVNVEKVPRDTGVTVRGLNDLDAAMDAAFAKYAPLAIAVKSQHAYNRTLRWAERTRADAERALASVLGDAATPADRLCLGDWCLARGVELAIAHDLPVKFHTGLKAGCNTMTLDELRPAHLCPLLLKYPKARFVLMHASWPYGMELIALAKQFSNVYADLCWAWAIDPQTALDFVRRYLHAAPANKLFGFGGDTHCPTGAVGFARQMRHWLTRALEEEIAAGQLGERQAIAVASRILRENQYDCFRVNAKRAAARQALARATG